MTLGTLGSAELSCVVGGVPPQPVTTLPLDANGRLPFWFRTGMVALHALKGALTGTAVTTGGVMAVDAVRGK
jgi:hypothetical protein